MLIWINFRPRRRKVVRPLKETSDQGPAASYPTVAARSPSLSGAEHGPNYSDAFASEEPVRSDCLESSNADAAQTGSATTSDQNSYADRVASAMAKLRKPSAGL
jgi:hypothetical protein